MLYMYLMPEGKKMFGWQILFVKIFVNFLSPLWHFFSMYLHKVENSSLRFVEYIKRKSGRCRVIRCRVTRSYLWNGTIIL